MLLFSRSVAGARVSSAVCKSAILLVGCACLGLGCGQPAAPGSSNAAAPTTSETPAASTASDAPTAATVPETAATEPDPAPAAETPEAKPATVAAKVATWADVQKLVADNAGKVVVVDLWSTSCEPCLREFPHLVALQQKHGDKVVCVSFDCDFIGARNKPVEYYRERVEKFLTEQKAEGLVNLMSTTAADELFESLNVDSIPAVYVYDTAGQLSKRFDNRTPASETEEGISYELQINPLVAQLTAESR